MLIDTHFDLTLFMTVFGLTFLAELPDKTAFATLLLATRRRPTAVFFGVALAFVVQSIFAVCCGRLFSLLPPKLVAVAAAAMFFYFAWQLWTKKDEDQDADDAAPTKRESFWADASDAFLVIFIAEWGDLTQLSTVTLSARYSAPLTIFAAATLALWSVSALAVMLGTALQNRLRPELVSRIAAVAFALVGTWLLVRGLSGIQ